MCAQAKKDIFPGYFLVLNGSQLRMPRCRPPPDISGNSQVYMNLGWNSASSTGEDSGYISAAQHNSSLSSTPHTGSRRSSSGQSSPSVQHNLGPAYFLTPVLCVHCNDYIWGSGQGGGAVRRVPRLLPQRVYTFLGHPFLCSPARYPARRPRSPEMCRSANGRQAMWWIGWPH
ncbi:uncharacterized protein LOC119586927 [Penaeus monodon]|uniref:uncharacterized protein LOC119586927 n=1 Tax=Penaeus monodon TaxID=6687 RepID=UPI0018A74423|nr:uncharacterized protein LOC119586927 [Penaeus monodon]